MHRCRLEVLLSRLFLRLWIFRKFILSFVVESMYSTSKHPSWLPLKLTSSFSYNHSNTVSVWVCCQIRSTISLPRSIAIGSFWVFWIWRRNCWEVSVRNTLLFYKVNVFNPKSSNAFEPSLHQFRGLVSKQF